MFRLTLLLLPLLFLTLLEISLRLGHYGYDPSFFKRITIGGQDCFVQNEEFSFRFFPRAIARNPGPLRFPVQKAPGTFRIFILGESAAMGDPAESVGPWRYLEMLLRKKYPDQKFEIINVAFTAINSNVILPIARECAGLQGDLWIIYMGNNEMVGPFGAATVFGRQAAPLPYVRLVTGLQRFRTGQLMTALARRFTGRHEEAATWGGMGMFLHNQIDPASPRKETVYRNFERNLHDIVRLGIGSGAKVLLNTVAVNLKDCPPFASVTNSQLSAPDRAQFEEQCAKATEASQRGDWQEAATRFEQAARIDAKSAELQFHWAQCLLAQTNPALAREHFQLACDNDALPFRADSRINAVIQAESKWNGAGTFMLLDAPAALAAIGESGICGQEAFYEHVHFDFAGRYGLGRAWAEQIEHCFPPRTNEWISQAECEQSLGLSEWNRAQVIHFMAERMQVPPLSGQPNNPTRKEALETRISQLSSRMTADSARGMSNVFVNLLEQRPDDYFLRQNFAVFLELTGYPVSAALEWERFRDLLPQDSLGFYQVGRLLIVQQRYAEAEGALRTSLAIRPSRTEAWIELGNAMALQKKYAEALVVYSTALSRDPQNAQTYLRMGKVLAHLDRHREAIEKYGRAIEFNPADGLSHFELGSELLAAHDEELAGGQFGEAARLLPTHVPSRFNYGTWLMKQKRWTEARTEFEAVLNLEPRNTRARQNLAWLKEKTQ
jgi:tetratricopeptide (TPR) repeat protein